MYNKVIMVGNLTRDIELKYLPNGSAIAKSAIATSHKYKLQNGEQKDEVCFLDFTVFGKGAEVLNQYVQKGSKVLLEGRLIFEQWTANDGTNRSRHTLRVSDFKFLDSKSDNMGASMQNNYQAPQQPSYNQPMQQQPMNSMQNSYNNTQVQQQTGGMNMQNSYEQNIPTIDIDDDEIPF